jgi:MFS family permease
MSQFRTPRDLWARLRTGVAQLTIGGRWATQLPRPDQHNLRAFFFDGFFAAASDAINLTYQTLYVLALGATNAQIGLMSALSSLSATLLLMPGAMLADRTRRRKPIVLWSGGGLARLMILFLALLPFVFKGSAAVYVAIALNVIMAGANNLPYSAWVSLTADVVPLSWRGRFFGTRNMVMSMVTIVMTLLAGQLITRMGSISGYQIAFLVAFLIGMLATYSYAHIKEPDRGVLSQGSQGYTLSSLLASLRGDRNFLAFCLYAMVWNFSLNIAGPFFNVYLVKALNTTAFMVGFLSIVSSMAGLPALRWFGQLNDRWGPHKVILLTGSIIPVVPFAWYFITSAWHVVPINILSGFLWAGYNLAMFNLLLAIAPEEQRARYSAIFQISVTISLALGASVGGLISNRWGIPLVFVVSAIGRAVGAGVFARFVKPHDSSLQHPEASQA